MPSTPNITGPFAAARTADLKRLHAWYREANQPPFFVEIAGPTPTFTLEEFTTYCQDDSRLWVRADGQGFMLLTYIQSHMHVANLDFNFRSIPEVASPQASDLASGIQLMCAAAKVRKAQLLAIATDARRIALAESLGMRHEGVLHEHFYHAGVYHDLVCLGWFEEHSHG